MTVNYSPNAKFALQMIEESKKKAACGNRKRMNKAETKELEQEQKDKDAIEKHNNEKHCKDTEKKKKQCFKNKVKSSLTEEAILYLYNKSLTTTLETANTEGIKRGMVSQFVNEEGVDNLLRRFKRSSYLLSEYASLIEDYTDYFVNEANKNENYDNIIDFGAKNDFYDKLESKDAEEVTNVIRDRVGDSLDKFIQNNIEDQAKIKETLQKAKEKIDKTSNENVQESYNQICKRRITDIRTKRQKNILESMIFNVSESAFKNENLKKMYVKENQLDMDSIVENCTTIYTFLETVNTAKIKKINTEYVIEFLNNLKA